MAVRRHQRLRPALPAPVTIPRQSPASPAVPMIVSVPPQLNSGEAVMSRIQMRAATPHATPDARPIAAWRPITPTPVDRPEVRRPPDADGLFIGWSPCRSMCPHT